MHAHQIDLTLSYVVPKIKIEYLKVNGIVESIDKIMPDNFFYNVIGSSFNCGNHICNCYHLFAINSCTGVQNDRLGGFKLIIVYSR